MKHRRPPRTLNERLLRRLRLLRRRASPVPSPPQHSLGVFAGQGMFVIQPSDPPVENVKGMKQNGYQWVAFNAFDGVREPGQWAEWRRQCEFAGLNWGWWARCYTAADLDRLVALTVETRRGFVILNVEDELASGEVTVDMILDACWPTTSWAIDYGLSTVAPVYHGVDWKRLTDVGIVIQPQAFMNVEPTLTAVGALEQAKSRGAGLVAPTIGLYPTPTSPRLTPHDYQPLPPSWSAYHVGAVTTWEA